MKNSKSLLGLAAALLPTIIALVLTGCPDGAGATTPESGATVTGITVSPATPSVAKGATLQFTATVTGTGNPAQTVTWEVSNSGSSISSTGLLTVAANESVSPLMVKATSTVDSTRVATAYVTVSSSDPSITPGRTISARSLEELSTVLAELGDEVATVDLAMDARLPETWAAINSAIMAAAKPVYLDISFCIPGNPIEGFTGNPYITGVTLPVTLRSINAYAFSGCTALTSVNTTSVTDIGNNAFSGCTTLANVNMASVNTIGSYVFSGCTALTSVNIPATVSIIEESAFSGCTALASVSMATVPISGGVSGVSIIKDNAFLGCISLASVNIPSSVTDIGDNAFSGTGLRTVTIPNEGNVPRIIGNNVFKNCTSLVNVNMGNHTHIEDYTFSGCTSLASVNFGTGVFTTIGSNAFSGCTALTSVTIPATVTSIGEKAFLNAGLTTIHIASGTIAIGQEAFSGASLTSVTFGATDGTTTIGTKAFEHCGTLSAVTFGSDTTATVIGEYAFSGCNTLNTVTFRSSGDTSIGDNAFNGTRLVRVTFGSGDTIIGSNAFSGCTALESVTFGTTGDTTIESHAFSGCTALTSVSIPASVATIGDSAFSGCTGLNALTLATGTTAIGGSAFSGCTGLATVSIPDSVATIGASAFNGCNNLTCVIFLGGNTTQWGIDTFTSMSGGSVVPTGNTLWTAYSDGAAGTYNFYNTTNPEGNLRGWEKQ